MGAELVLRVNVYGLRHLTESLLAGGHDRPTGGSIVSIASLAGMAWERHIDRIAALDAAADFDAGIDVAKAYDRGGPAAYVLSKEWVVAYTKRLAGRLLRQTTSGSTASAPARSSPRCSRTSRQTPGSSRWRGSTSRSAGPPSPRTRPRSICWLAVGEAAG